MVGGNPPIHDGDPQCGWFKTRMISGGPFVPARIWIDRDIDPQTGELAADEKYRCEVNGEPRNPYQTWSSIAGTPISRADFDALQDTQTEIATMAATHTKIDLSQEVIAP